MRCYQPELTEEEWKTAKVPMGEDKVPFSCNGVYISKERCQRDFPDHKIVEYSGDTEGLVYIDMIQEIPGLKRLLRNKKKRKK